MPNTTEETGMSSGLELSRVSFRAPSIWKSDVDLWFLQIESNFKIAGITDPKTQFHCVVTALDVEVLSYVSDLIIAPVTDDSYNQLKTRICQQFSLSETSRLRVLLQELTLGDKRPSQLLHEMHTLAGKKISDEVLKTLWLQRLPIHTQQILSVSKDTLPDLAEMADKITEVTGHTPTISEVSRNETISLQSLQSQISTLTVAVDRLSRYREKNFNKKGRVRSNSRSRERSSGDGTPKRKPYCWYHFKFGRKASKCIKPCDWSEN
jgi:hypothetical protein